ncbi:Fanconi anemia group I protein like protein [Dufourea novaeangliae]|uniref:Fanconi anemia group I protein like protein n=1 Tax=Dufourea novaeangliae TaxID=178035 RepID=A0A154P2B2_DUFNO|nr:Fanconi anemia group I protein like protein [Dufourea novaeangliae]
MYQQFQNLRDRDEQIELRTFVRDLNVEELAEIIRSSICKADAPKILDDIFQAFSDSEAGQLKRRMLVESTLRILGTTKIPTIHVDSIVNRVILDFPKYSKQHLLKLVDFSLTCIHDDNNDLLQWWKDLLPVLLEALKDEKYIVYRDAEVSGTEYKSLIVKSICNYQWNIDNLPSLAKMFGDMALDKADRRVVIKTLCHSLPELSLSQVPPFVYQALKLCRDHDNQYLLHMLCKYFEYCYQKAISNEERDSLEDVGTVSIKEVKDVESTVLYHVYQHVQLNHENLKDFIRYLKSVSYTSEYILQPFMLAVLMSVFGIYADQIFEILKAAIINNSLDKEKRQNNAWLRQLLPSEINIINIIRRIIDTSNKDRHMVLKGLIDLAFMLMSTDQKLKNNTTVVWYTGTEIIREIIKKRHDTVAIVLQELVDKIVVGGIPTMHYTDCLKYACRELSVIVLDHQVWIMTLLERLLLLPTAAADQVLHAILPLMHVSPNIRENLFLTLRKALYRKGVSKRQMAVTGFLDMLKYSKMHSLGSFRLSQRSGSSAYAISSSARSTLTQVTLEHNTQQEKSITEMNKTLCFEILDILKKSLTYEFQVRLHLYEGLYGAVTRNPEITEIVLDMLLSHLSLYLEEDNNVLPPVKFELCADIEGMEVILKEPIAELIFAIQKIYMGKISRKSNVSDKLHTVLESLCRRMAATELEHLNLGRGTDLFEDFSKSQIKLKNLSITITIYEALIAFRIGEWSLRENSDICYSVEDLFRGYSRSVDFIKMQSIKTKKIDGAKAKKDKDVNNTTKKLIRSSNIKIPSTVMDLDTIYQCLSLLYSRPDTGQNRNVMLRENGNFCCYIFHICEQLLQKTKSVMVDTCRGQSNLYIDIYIEIGGLLYKYFLLNLTDAVKNDEQVAVSALQCYKEISHCICTLVPSELPRFLETMLQSQTKKDSVSKDVNFQLQQVISSLNVYFIESLAEETSDTASKKIPFLLLQVIEQFAYKINFANCNGEKVFKCVKEIAQTKEVESSIVSVAIPLLLRLEEYTQEYGEILNEICLKLCEKVGAIDDSELTSNEQYKIIREATFMQIYNALNDHIKEKLNNASWLLLRLKAEDIIVRAHEGTADEICNNNLREKERSLCKQLSYLIQVLHTLVNTSIEPGPCTDTTFRNLQCLYHLLGNLTKYFYGKSNSQNAAFQTVKFIQVVQLAGKPLKSAFYNLVTHVEENQNNLNSKSDSYAQRNKILRETKIIPRVVYEIEQFNKEVLLLGKRTGIPLENYMKRSVTRDFRIKNPQLVEGIEKMDVSQLTPSYSEATENEIRSLNTDKSSSTAADDTTPSKKRRRIEN